MWKSNSKHYYFRAVFPNLLMVAEHLTIKSSKNPSYLVSNFIFKHNILWISNFSGSTSKLLAEHLWSPDKWLGTTGLEYRKNEMLELSYSSRKLCPYI